MTIFDLTVGIVASGILALLAAMLGDIDLACLAAGLTLLINLVGWMRK